MVGAKGYTPGPCRSAPATTSGGARLCNVHGARGGANTPSCAAGRGGPRSVTCQPRSSRPSGPHLTIQANALITFSVTTPHRRFKDAIYEQFARVGKAVSAPKRLELLDLLCQGPR